MTAASSPSAGTATAAAAAWYKTMMVSSRGRYALRVMADLAENEKDGAFIPLKEIAEREELSLKYLESIMTTLSKAGLVEGARTERAAATDSKESRRSTESARF